MAYAPFLLGSTLVIAAVAIGVAIWVVIRSPLLGLPLTCGVALLAGLWIRQTGTFIGVDVGARRAMHQHDRTATHDSTTASDRLDPPAPLGGSDRLLLRLTSVARIGSAMLLSLGFTGLVASLIYLFFRSRF